MKTRGSLFLEEKEQGEQRKFEKSGYLIDKYIKNESRKSSEHDKEIIFQKYSSPFDKVHQQVP